MRIVLNIVGILCLPIGGVWILQGLDVIRQGGMSGHRRYVALGALLIVVGVVLIVIANRKRRTA